MMKKLFCLLLIAFCGTCYAQNKTVYDLRHALNIATTDSARCAASINLCYYYFESNRDSALYYAERWLQIAKRNNQWDAEAEALQKKSTQYRDLNQYAQALAFMQLSFKIADDPANRTKKTWSISNANTYQKKHLSLLSQGHLEMGWLMGATGDTLQQITHFKTSASLAEQIGDKFVLGLIAMGLGSLYIDKANTDSVLLLEKKAENYFTQAGVENYMGYCYTITAYHYLHVKHDPKRFLQDIHQAVAFDLKTSNLASLGVDYAGVANFYIGLKKADSSLYYSKKTFEALHIVLANDLADTYECLYKSYQLNHQTDSAYKYLALALTAKNSKYDATIKSLNNFQKLAFKDQLRLQAVEKEKDAIQTKIRTYVLLSGIGVFMLLAGIFYRNNRQKQKANELLNQQKEEIEAQTREAKIEAALERVRSRTMAMQKSGELAEVIQVIFDQFVVLNFNISAANFNTNYLAGDESNTWMASLDRVCPARVFIPYFDHPVFKTAIQAKESGQDHVICNLTTDETRQFWGHFFKNAFPLPEFPPEIRDRIYNSPGYYSFTAIIKSVSLTIINYSGYPYMESEQAVIMRFGNVFAQTYTRFKDLEQAEAQAREARIEAALERIRSRSLAMFKTDDMRFVVGVLFEQMQGLSIEMGIGSVSIYIFEEGTRNHVMWVTLPDGITPVRVPYFEDPIYADLFDAKENGDNFFAKAYTVEQKNSCAAKLFELSDYKYFPEELKAAIIEAPGYAMAIALEKNSGICIPSFSGKIPPAEDVEVMKRVGRVFEQAYIRFLDLQKAEAQAREGQIEAALERVRGKALAMNNSADLTATASKVFTELRSLGINPIRCGVGMINNQSRKAALYAATSSIDGDSLEPAGWLMLEGHPVLDKIYGATVNNQEYYPVLKGKQLKACYGKLLSGVSLPTLPRFHPGEEHFGHFFPFADGSLYAWSERRYDDAEIRILRRFASVIDLIFRRYKELQRSESSAREAVRAASLDRVRAEIASMRTISDLDRITPLIWNELTILGVPFIRCGVFIIDEPQQQIHSYLSSPDGKAIAAFQIPFVSDSNNAIGPAALKGWREKQIVAVHWNEEEFRSFSHTLAEQGKIASEENYLTAHPPTSLDLHFFPFLQGLMYAGSTAPLSNEDKDLVQSLADAFSTAYARYEDFNKLEAAKQQVDQTLSGLKAAQTQLIQSEKMASLGVLTAGIAHEIQNPLNFVNNFSEVNKELLTELKQELAARNYHEVGAIADDVIGNEEKINHHGKRADSIVKGMLQHSRASSHAKEPTNINTLADEYLRLSYHGLRAKDKSFNAEMVTHFDASLPKVNLIPQDIGRVLLNLFNNAFYAVNQKAKTALPDYKPEVSVTTSAENGQVVIQVKDNGNGIPEAIKDKIMQPFFTTKPTGEGTGLGLSLTYDMVVKGHGGEIELDTEEGVYTAFKITLPNS